MLHFNTLQPLHFFTNCRSVATLCYQMVVSIFISFFFSCWWVQERCLVYFFYFFPFIFIHWRLITLQYRSGFCHTLTWISHGFTCVPHPDPPSCLPLHPIPLGLPSAPALSLSEKCKSKPQWGTITRQSEWLLSKSLQAINAGEGVEKREPSYTVGGNAN